MHKKIKVMLADDHAIVRAGLRTVINKEPDMEVVGEAGDPKDALMKIGELQPDVLVLDLSMPEGGGMKALPKVRKACATTRVIVLTMHDDPAYVRSVLASGGWGYILKQSADLDVVRAIRSVQRGRRFIDSTLAGSILEEAAPRDASADLSHREKEVLKFLAEGHPYQAIAEKMHVSIKTVESYRARIVQKLGFRNRAEIIRYALMIGLLNPEDTHNSSM
jgi:DNA-binding NarL/FixJ family response regulator